MTSRNRRERLTRCRRVVVPQFGELDMLGRNLDNVAVAAAGAGAMEGLEGHAAAVWNCVYTGVDWQQQ
jgi:hypothetical protein